MLEWVRRVEEVEAEGCLRRRLVLVLEQVLALALGQERRLLLVEKRVERLGQFVVVEAVEL